MPYLHEVTPEVIAQRLSNPRYSYYSSEYAEAMRPTFDAMIADKLPRQFSCERYGRTLSSLDKLIRRSLMYLVDHNDPSGVYKQFKKQTMIKQNYKKDAIDIKYKVPAPNVSGSDSLADESANAQANWQQSLDMFICDGEAGTQIIIDNINLNAEEIDNVRAGIAGLSEIELVTIDSRKIVLKKLL